MDTILWNFYLQANPCQKTEPDADYQEKVECVIH